MMRNTTTFENLNKKKMKPQISFPVYTPAKGLTCRNILHTLYPLTFCTGIVIINTTQSLVPQNYVVLFVHKKHFETDTRHDHNRFLPESHVYSHAILFTAKRPNHFSSNFKNHIFLLTKIKLATRMSSKIFSRPYVVRYIRRHFFSIKYTLVIEKSHVHTFLKNSKPEIKLFYYFYSSKNHKMYIKHLNYLTCCYL